MTNWNHEPALTFHPPAPRNRYCLSPKREPFRNARNYSTTRCILVHDRRAWRINPGLSRSVLVIGLLGGSSFLSAGFFSVLPWAVSGPIAGVLLGSWFGGEIKKRLDRAGEMGKETRVVRFGQKAALENSVSEMRIEGWEPKWESYRETQTGTVIHRIVYSVVMERRRQRSEHGLLRRLTRIRLHRK